MLSGAAAVAASSPPLGTTPISGVLAHDVAGPATADWNPGTGVLDLGIPGGAGIDDVQVDVLPPGSAPEVKSLNNGVLTLGLASGRDGSPADPFVVAAGRFGPNGGRVWSVNDLTATPVTGFPGVFFLTFKAFDPKASYAITGTPLISLARGRVDGAGPTRTFELVEDDDALREALKGMAAPRSPDDGFTIRVVADDLKTTARGFSVEVNDYSKVLD
jgi:hypothetical protein